MSKKCPSNPYRPCSFHRGNDEPCDKQATRMFRAEAGYDVPLCDAHSHAVNCDRNLCMSHHSNGAQGQALCLRHATVRITEVLGESEYETFYCGECAYRELHKQHFGLLTVRRVVG